MKVYISADIEGIATTTNWDETISSNIAYPPNAKEMTEEVLAACEGALRAGATEILVRDAHGGGTNIDMSRFPEEVDFIRGWDGHPYMMVQGIDGSFDAAIFIGYHSAAGSMGSPMCHTMTLRTQKVFINGFPASEFMIYSYCAALEGVPTVFLSGDANICQEGKALYPWLSSVATKEGIGSSIYAHSPARAKRLIAETVENALKGELKSYKPVLPEHFSIDLIYKEQTQANTMSYFPGIVRTDSHTLHFESDDFFDVARKLKFLL